MFENNVSSKASRILLLDNRLANQIAAGEVVERPASVVKELVENSIDSGANRIEVDIERGGARLIRVTDNGKGIHKDDLTLALTRHATSKIHTTNDLANIRSLGFRGEALASISSVSHLTLTSRLHQAELAWQAIAQGREMTIDILPAAASQGTRLEVADLFFNTPARQKFLRTEKTEFNHIEEFFKCYALANFDIAFVLKHNHKVVKRVPACGNTEQHMKRIAAICGKSFADNAVTFKCQHEQVKIDGWLGKPSFHRSESDIQYVFINQRPVKDKILNHAIRQAYEGLLPPGRMATYVIFLQVDPHQIDVNVHPTKHEVRFGEQRLIHDLLAKSLRDALADYVETSEILTSFHQNNSNIENHHYESQKDFLSDACQVKELSSNYGASNTAYANAVDQKDHQSEGCILKTDISYQASHLPISDNTLSHAKNLFHVKNNLWLVKVEQQQIVLVNAQLLLLDYLSCLFTDKKKPQSVALLFPKVVSLSDHLLEDYAVHEWLQKLGFVGQVLSGNQVEIKKIPAWLDSFDSETVFSYLSLWLKPEFFEKTIDFNQPEIIMNAFDKIPETLFQFLYSEMHHDWFNSQAVKKIKDNFFENIFDDN